MTKEREALKLGIESLEWHNQHMHRKISEQAIAAMKKALVQPEQDWIERERAVGYREGHQNALKQMAQQEQEPVTLPENKKLILVDSSFDDLMYWLERCESKGHLENCSDLIEPWEKFCDSYCVWTDHHPNCKLAEQSTECGEPVACVTYKEVADTMNGLWGGTLVQRQIAEELENTMLYTTPPQRTWVGLTDEEVNKLVDDEDWYNFPHEFAKAIEAKLKEKNT